MQPTDYVPVSLLAFFLVIFCAACLATTLHPCMAQRYVGTPVYRTPEKTPEKLPPLEVCEAIVVRMPDGDYMLGHQPRPINGHHHFHSLAPGP